jgi:hypothetical protein
MRRRQLEPRRPISASIIAMLVRSTRALLAFRSAVVTTEGPSQLIDLSRADVIGVLSVFGIQSKDKVPF